VQYGMTFVDAFFCVLRFQNISRHIFQYMGLRTFLYGYIMDTKKEQKMKTQIVCEQCDIICSSKYNYTRHCLTDKHNKVQNGTKKENPEQTFYTCHCGNNYKYSQGLSRHKKKCIQYVEPTNKELMMTLIKQNAEQSKQNAELHAKIIELCKNGITNNTITNTNSHNKTFNLQFFLNETCKDAMNLKDFIDSVVLQLSDIDNIGEVGFVKGMANLIISKINLLGETKRPIHCTDSKREVMYVKDENKWEKDAKKEKMRLLIQKMEKQLPPLMIAFSNNHKQKYRTDSEIIKHQQIIREVYGGVNDDITKNEIIQHISKKTTIEKG